MSSISGSVVNTSFAYDANGNQTGGNGLTLTYASFNKPATIARGSALIAFAHDSEHQRYKQMNPAGETLYLSGSGGMAERLLGAGGVVQWTNYLSVGGEMVAMRVDRSDATTYTRYFHTDHLGSIATITDAAGAVVERLSYDAWGKRRFPNGQDDPSGSIASQTTRGFTGHEQLADVGLIHMNGRVYDPMLGRFGTPDPMTEDPYNSQGWNRYAYVGNSPLNATDPSGYCWKGCFWQAPFKALGAALRRVPILGNILTVAAAAICTPAGLGPVCGALASAAVTGLASGDLGQAIKAGVIAAATAGAFHVAGTLTSGLPFANIAAHAAIGCGASVASGGKCGPGALSGAVGSSASHILPDLGFHGNVVAHAVVGGLASVAGGGKFGNGAVTAAFGYLFNFLSHPVLRATVPGQVAFDNGMTALEQGAYGSAIGNFALMVGEQMLTVLTFGEYQVGASFGKTALSQADDALVGTSFGKLGTVTGNPEQSISGITKHAVNNAITRGVRPSAIVNTVHDPLVVLQQSNNTFLYLSNQAAVVMNQSGRIVTTYPSSMFSANIRSIINQASR